MRGLLQRRYQDEESRSVLREDIRTEASKRGTQMGAVAIFDFFGAFSGTWTGVLGKGLVKEGISCSVSRDLVEAQFTTIPRM